ncbi:hypothetical protein F361_064 [Campylobacter phage F361]|uniref:Uncharacterized protein n=2 Tax=Fletchervirus CPX TaxID=1110702 RepID=A0A7T3KGH8_9CAUD|nr:hypothetical protein F361_064 [Campylobacter phage F361]QPX64853.1 hypothetical protein F368_062 [Campylobacter phage F368]
MKYILEIDTNHTWSCSTSDGYVDSIMKEWIDWIVDNKEIIWN